MKAMEAKFGLLRKLCFEVYFLFLLAESYGCYLTEPTSERSRKQLEITTTGRGTGFMTFLSFATR